MYGLYSVHIHVILLYEIVVFICVDMILLICVYFRFPVIKKQLLKYTYNCSNRCVYTGQHVVCNAWETK